MNAVPPVEISQDAASSSAASSMTFSTTSSPDLTANLGPDNLSSDGYGSDWAFTSFPSLTASSTLESEIDLSAGNNGSDKDSQRGNDHAAIARQDRRPDSPDLAAATMFDLFSDYPKLEDLFPSSLIQRSPLPNIRTAATYFEAAVRSSDSRRRDQEAHMKMRLKMRAKRRRAKQQEESGAEEGVACTNNDEKTEAAPALARTDWVKQEAEYWLALIEQQSSGKSRRPRDSQAPGRNAKWPISSYRQRQASG